MHGPFPAISLLGANLDRRGHLEPWFALGGSVTQDTTFECTCILVGICAKIEAQSL
jgi:hypothetical protein